MLNEVFLSELEWCLLHVVVIIDGKLGTKYIIEMYFIPRVQLN